MSPKNETSDVINNYVMKQLPGVADVFVSADSVEDNQAAMYPTEFLKTLIPNGMPPHRLILKTYASIILLRSLDPTLGLCNGTRLTIRSVTKHLIDAEIATGSHVGSRVFIPRIPLLTPTDSCFPFVLKRRQFPIRPAFCITINKCQGQSLESVGIFLPSPEAIFSHGQLYVALSRVQNPRSLKILVCGGKESASGGVLVKNVVYREIFQTQREKFLSTNIDLCSSFSQHAPTISSQTILNFIPVKRGLTVDDYTIDRKVSKLNEFSNSDLIALDPKEYVPSNVSQASSGNLFCEVIRSPRDMTLYSGIASLNTFTLAMRLNIAHSIGLFTEEILPNREDISRRETSLSRYYTSLAHNLSAKFGIKLRVCPVYGDGNCLYRALSHIITGNEWSHHILKQRMIYEFEANPHHYFNVMRVSGIFSEEDLRSHHTRIKSPNEWGTNTELNMIGALARIDVISLDATDIDPNNWSIRELYIHDQLEIGQKLGIIYHRINHQVGMEHFDPLYALTK